MVDKSQTHQKGESPLSPYRVLDLTNEWGLLCGKILADLGADVIKIEKPGGDPSRNIGPFYHDIADPEKSLFWFAFNTNKKGITLNIETADGQAIFKKLAKTADFVIESFNPGYLDRLELSYSELSKINHRIIMVSITPFGQTGPYSQYKASDLVVLALSGLMAQCGDPDRPPVMVGFPQSFVNAGTDAAVGAMVAHHRRELTGEGQHVDVSAMESTLWTGTEVLPEWFFLKLDSSRVGHAFRRPNGLQTPVIWECKDGYVSFLLIAGLPGARANQRMVEWMDSEGLASDYLKGKDWEAWDWETTTQEELDSVAGPLAHFFKLHTQAEIQEETAKRGISCYPIYAADGILADPQLKAREFWMKVPHDELNDIITYPGEFAKFSETPIKAYCRAPLIGEHNKELYKEELGYSSEKIAALKAGGII